MEPDSEITRMLRGAKAGGATGRDDLLEHLYPNLRMTASKRLSAGRDGQTRQPTGLIHESNLEKLQQNENSDWEHRW